MPPGSPRRMLAVADRSRDDPEERWADGRWSVRRSLITLISVSVAAWIGFGSIVFLAVH